MSSFSLKVSFKINEKWKKCNFKRSKRKILENGNFCSQFHAYEVIGYHIQRSKDSSRYFHFSILSKTLWGLCQSLTQKFNEWTLQMMINNKLPFKLRRILAK